MYNVAHLLALAIGLLVRLQCVTATDYFTSITGLEQLLGTEQILLSELSAQLETTKRYVTLLESEAQAIQIEHALAAQDMENYLTNPVNVYRLMKRLHNDWQIMAQRVQQMAVDIYFHERLNEHRTILSFPSQEDVEGSALALVRLQSTYKLDVAQVAAGILNGIKYGTDMSWQDCFVLGKQLFEMEDYNNTKMWLRESMERLRREPQHRPEAVTLNAMEFVAKSLFQLGEFDTAYELSQRVLEYDPNRVRNWHLGDKGANFERDEMHPKYTDSYSQTHEFQQYEKVCRGEVMPTATQLRPLRCRLLHGGHGFRLLAPLKVEEHNLDPLIVIFHDMIDSHKIDTLKEMAVPHMRRSTVNPLAGKTSAAASKTSAFRVSKNAWLPYVTHTYMLQMLRDLHDATGLDMTYCEQLQVANYGVGGHYEPHWDFFRDERLYPAEEGNRIATAIYYLSDVEQGGATAFPFLNIAVQPRKGNVLFWYNLHRSLDMDFRTKHAGCPVLKGSKWIGNVWIHDMTQTFTRPCDIFRDNEVSLEYEFIK